VNGEHGPLMLWIEGVVALVIALAFLLHAFFAFKPEHVEHHPARVRIGALIQGLAIGLMIGFVVVPLRMQYMDVIDPRSAPGLSTLSFVPARCAAEGAGAEDVSARLSPRNAAEGAR